MTKKIIVRIAEGLGNQLFMYANSLSLSRKINYNLFIDNESGYFQKKNIRSYQLDNFNIDTPICENKYKFNNQLKNIKRKILIKLDRYKKKKTFLLEKKDYLKKTKFVDNSRGNFSNILYIEGHYESEKYFHDLKNVLIEKFTLKNQHIYQKNEYFGLIENNKNVISICVRQNRFSERLSNKYDQNQKNKSDEFTKSTINYIKRSVNFIDQKIDNAKYLVWSNDFSNLREYFPSEKFTFVDIKENKSLSDFYLLLNCKNFIVGPTSFHWWPAWLNSKENSITIRPKDIDISNNSDFWPNNWIPI
tara:strand:+ start:50 stop:961 length:912 start_codon:yes stop_codon:yes gene_type:complete